MFFSRAVLSRSAFGRDENWTLETNGYRAHQIVWSLFSDQEERKRDFIFHWDTEGRLPVLYTVSEREPHDREGYFGRLQSKEYSPQVSPDEPFAFVLRANPVVKQRDEEGRQRVHDVVMYAKKQLIDEGSWEAGSISQSELVYREGLSWLNSRAKQYGFRVEDGDVLTEVYQRHAFKKPRNNKDVVISTIDFRGRLFVTDPEKFTEALMNGVGPSKAFGCGLLMIRPL